MRICLLVEGAYPYIMGGVSSWVHQLIKETPDHQFVVLSIMPDKYENIEYKYESLPNLIEVKTIFLNEHQSIREIEKKPKLTLGKEEIEHLNDLLALSKSTDLSKLIPIFKKDYKPIKLSEFIRSDLFFDGVVKSYNKSYHNESFIKYYWTVRSVFIPLTQMFFIEPPTVDLFHAVSAGYAGFLGAILKLKTNKGLILTEHGIYYREREEEILKAKWLSGVFKQIWIDFFGFQTSKIYEHADIIYSLFEKNRAIQHQLGASVEKTKVVPNGVVVDEIGNRPVKNIERIAAVLRVVPIKDVKNLITAFGIVYKNAPYTRLDVIGPTDEDPDYYESCREYVTVLGLDEVVTFTGPKNMSDYYPKIDLLVLSSVSEGQPLVILEAMAHKIPVVSTNVGACEELLSENQFEKACGLIAKIANPKDLANKIQRLLIDPELAKQMGENGYERVKRAYLDEQMYQAYHEAYQLFEGK